MQNIPLHISQLYKIIQEHGRDINPNFIQDAYRAIDYTGEYYYRMKQY
jgi:hypothetical protein